MGPRRVAAAVRGDIGGRALSARYAAIDAGTNSTRLLIGDGDVTDERQMRITRLGAGVDADGRLAPDAIERVLDCLRDYRSVMDRFELAGTVSTVAAVELGLPAYDRDRVHHLELSKAAVEDVFRTLATEPLVDRVHNPGLERERADVIVGGCCVLVSIMRTFGFERCLVSEADILDGLVRSQLPR